MSITKINNNQVRFQDPTGVVFIPWVGGKLGADGYDIHDIVGDTFSLTQDDANRTEIPWEFGDDPLDENVSLGNRNLTMQCLDFQDIIMEKLFGWDTDVDGFAAAPSQYEDLWCCIVLQFKGKSVVMPKVKMDSKTVLENLRTDIARGELSGVLYSTEVKRGTSTAKEYGLFFMKDGKSFTIGDDADAVTVSVSASGELSISGSSAATAVLTITSPSHGTIEGAANGEAFVPGTMVWLTAVPETGYEFTKWTIGSDEIAQNPVAFAIQGAITVAATFSAE